MDIKTLCLGVLNFGAASGYDIKKYFECTFSHFFAAGFGSIYPALAELTRDGLVTCREMPQEGKPDRKVYSLTDTGRQAFVDALTATPPSHKIRSEFLVLTFFAHLLPPERLNEILDQRLEEMQQSIAKITEYEQQQREMDTPDHAGVRFCAGFGKTMMQTASNFIRLHREELLTAARSTPSQEFPARTQE